MKWLGKEPPLSEIKNPQQHPNYAPIVWPNEKQSAIAPKTSNSLWNGNSKSFFADGRARNVGDILKVKVNIKDKAALDNKTERTRGASEKLGVPEIYGLTESIIELVPKASISGPNLLSVSGNMDNTGEGSIEREEEILTEIAAVVMQKLPNGNLVIYGSQEVRVNFEIRQLTIQGVVRPSDIGADNIINSSQIAEARISYGGKGIISDMQQPRIGNQVIDILSPW
jgi:flagellar L-ring protein precursor FlgH